MKTLVHGTLIAAFTIVCVIFSVIYWSKLVDNAFGLIVGLIAGGLLTAIVGHFFGTRQEVVSQSEYDAVAQKDEATVYYILAEGKSYRASRWGIAVRRMRRLLPRASRPAR